MDRLPATILFVCTGNTCRSPMAAALCVSLIAKKYPEYKEKIKVLSAGCAAFEGSPATREAVKAIAARELSLTDHRARKLDAGVLLKADLIVTMSEGHWQYIVTNWPQVQAHTYTLKELAGEAGDVIDPLGLSEDFYQETAEELELLLSIMLDNVLGNFSVEGPGTDQEEY